MRRRCPHPLIFLRSRKFFNSIGATIAIFQQQLWLLWAIPIRSIRFCKSFWTVAKEASFVVLAVSNLGQSKSAQLVNLIRRCTSNLVSCTVPLKEFTIDDKLCNADRPLSLLLGRSLISRTCSSLRFPSRSYCLSSTTYTGVSTVSIGYTVTTVSLLATPRDNCWWTTWDNLVAQWSREVRLQSEERFRQNKDQRRNNWIGTFALCS